MKILSFLLIEDDELEKIKFKRILSKLNTEHQIINASNGEEALLKIDEGHVPDVILLDLNMPKMNGLEFLSFLKDTNFLMHIPVVVFSTSYNKEKIKQCYERGASGYIVKPINYEEYEKKVKSFVSYWEWNEVLKI